MLTWENVVLTVSCQGLTFFILFSAMHAVLVAWLIFEAYIENKVCCIDFGLASNMGHGAWFCMELVYESV